MSAGSNLRKARFKGESLLSRPALQAEHSQRRSIPTVLLKLRLCLRAEVRSTLPLSTGKHSKRLSGAHDAYGNLYLATATRKA
jgi:hypothetical protein